VAVGRLTVFNQRALEIRSRGHMPRSLAGNVALVGGSLAGLATAIGLARRGMPVDVFEQNAGEERGGTGLGIERDLITATTGVDAHVDGITSALPVVNEGYRDTSTWLAIYRWLRAVADATDRLTLYESARVDTISSDDRAAYLTGPHVNASADVVIGADGYRSVVRRAVWPARPFAPYGGFLIWRALVEESWLPARLLDQASLGGGRSPHAKTARLVVYRVPGPNGETSRGKRSITLAWYDASRTQWLRDQGYLVGEEVMGSVPPTAIDDEHPTAAEYSRALPQPESCCFQRGHDDVSIAEAGHYFIAPGFTHSHTHFDATMCREGSFAATESRAQWGFLQPYARRARRLHSRAAPGWRGPTPRLRGCR